MSQSKRASLIEVVVGIVVGMVVSFAIGHWLYPALGHKFSHMDNFLIVVVFTVASLIRGYGIRRLFNLLHVKGFFT